jgi:hypothetical protein
MSGVTAGLHDIYEILFHIGRRKLPFLAREARKRCKSDTYNDKYRLAEEVRSRFSLSARRFSLRIRRGSFRIPNPRGTGVQC